MPHRVADTPVAIRRFAAGSVATYQQRHLASHHLRSRVGGNDARHPAVVGMGRAPAVMSERSDVGEPKVDDEFIRHEFDEAIASHGGIVRAGTKRAKSHPFPAGREAITSLLKDDQGFLKQLKSLGKPYGATGEVESVAGSMLEAAGEADSEAYEAHAVLLSLKRKQQDSGAAMLHIARARKDVELRDAATQFERRQREGAKVLADPLASFAVETAQTA